MNGDTLLETLQTDVAAYLANVPALADVQIIVDNQGDTEAMVTRALGVTKAGATGKFGLCLVVLLPEVVDTDENLPGPPLRVEIELQTLEHVQTNRGPQGTGLRSSQVALIALGALHHLGLGSHALHAAKDPVTPLPVKAGLVSHAVRLRCLSNGVEVTAKCGQVTAEIVEGGAVQITGTTDPDVSGFYVPAGTLGGKTRYDRGDSVDIGWSSLGNVWVIHHPAAEWYGYEPMQYPYEVSAWSIGENATGSPVVSAAACLTLACATDGSAIWYTTDGSYPIPYKSNLYSVPLAIPAAGTLIRAAAYKTDMNPGDCTEILITE